MYSSDVDLFSGLFQLSLPFEFLKCDPQTYDPIRTDTGHCIKVSKGEIIISALIYTLIFKSRALSVRAGALLCDPEEETRSLEGNCYLLTGLRRFAKIVL